MLFGMFTSNFDDLFIDSFTSDEAIRLEFKNTRSVVIEKNKKPVYRILNIFVKQEQLKDLLYLKKSLEELKNINGLKQNDDLYKIYLNKDSKKVIERLEFFEKNFILDKDLEFFRHFYDVTLKSTKLELEVLFKNKNGFLNKEQEYFSYTFLIKYIVQIQQTINYMLGR